MRLGLSQDQQQVPMRSASDIMPPPSAAPTTKEIPYDYVAKFTLTGDTRQSCAGCDQHQHRRRLRGGHDWLQLHS